MNEWIEKLNQLFEQNVEEVLVPKEDFLTVRTLLIEKEWLQRVVGEAKHGGITIYRLNIIENE
ncbi:hypothetical protein [Exiguobacterium algae]|uniref:hypothetical protein n=1 Tax=Exiguobacterium algae TaxID=2751250 RepID=UPI001BE5BCA1|nr:hypothetical protein [Exiguobacterium algae]